MGWIVLIGIALLGSYAVSLYKALVRRRTGGENAWSDIDVQLKRRRDLVPNLVSSVKGFASHEQETLEAVIQARSQTGGGGGPAPVAESEGCSTSTTTTSSTGTSPATNGRCHLLHVLDESRHQVGRRQGGKKGHGQAKNLRVELGPQTHHGPQNRPGDEYFAHVSKDIGDDHGDDEADQNVL